MSICIMLAQYILLYSTGITFQIKKEPKRSQMTSLVPFRILPLFIFCLSLFRLYVVLLAADTLSGTARASATAILSSAPLFTLFVDYTACIKTNDRANQNCCQHRLSSLKNQQTQSIYNKRYKPSND